MIRRMWRLARARTPKVRSTRARQFFAAALGPKVRLVMHPVATEPFDPEHWWENRTDLRQTVTENVALVTLWGRGLWRAVAGEATLFPPAVTVR